MLYLCFYNYFSNIHLTNNNQLNTMFTYKYRKHEFYIFVEYYHGIITFKTDYYDEPIKQRFMYYSEAEAKKQFRQYLRDIINNPTKHNIFIEQ